MLAAISVTILRKSRAIPPLISQTRVMGGRSCSNVRGRGTKKCKESMMATAAVTMIVMTAATIVMTAATTRTATTVKAHDQPSDAGRLPPIVPASTAFNGHMIAVRGAHRM